MTARPGPAQAQAQSQSDTPRDEPAAFINAIAEEGTKAEAIEYLQKEWNANCALRRELAEAKHILQKACDRDWKDETLYQTAVIASNAIYWRDQRITELVERCAAAARQGAAPSAARALVDEQALDAALWFNAQTAPEAYLQRALRALHAAVESQGAAPAAGAGATNNAAQQDTAVQRAEEVAAGDARSETPAGAAPAPSKGPPLTYDPNAYRSVRRDAVEAILRAFGPDSVEAAELLDCITAPLQQQQEWEQDVDLEKALEHLGQARYFLLRVPS